MSIQDRKLVANHSDSKKEREVCNAFAATVCNGTEMTTYAPPAAGTQRARLSGSFQVDGLGTEDKISRVAPSGRISVKSTGVGNASISEMLDTNEGDNSWLNVVDVEVQYKGSSALSQAESYEAAVAIKADYFSLQKVYREKNVGHRAHHPNPCSSQGALGSYYSRSKSTPST